MSVVVAEDVRKRYGDHVALAGVSLSLDAGELYALVGPNGAGKTTLVRALTGTTRAEGSVETFGVAPADLDPARLGLLPQEFGPPERLTPRELLDYYGGLYDDRRPADEVLADVGLAGDADRRYERLSGGQKRRACVATALVNDPDLLVLDEPTTGIDPAGRRDVWGLLEELAAAGTTVLFTTHYMEEAAELADRVGMLADGELVAEGPPDALVARHGGDPRLTVAAPDRTAAAGALDAAGFEAVRTGRRIEVPGIAPEEIGAVAAALGDAGVEFSELTWRGPDLEEVYLRATGYGVGAGGEPVARDAAAEGDRAPRGGRDAAGGDPTRGDADA
ncbi:MAG: ABC transporter ATP-binding protein [Haloarculaceae archaeon]